MSTIPISISEEAFELYISPYLSKAKRGYVSRIPLYKIFNYLLYWLYTGCQWQALPIERSQSDPTVGEISWHAVYYHHRKWSRDGSLERVWQGSLHTIQATLKLTQLNLDGTHAFAKKGGESVAYQKRKQAKTSNILPFMDANGAIIATTGIIAGNHHDAFQLKPHLQQAFKSLKRLGIPLKGIYFNADAAFDTKEARQTCFNYGLIPNMAENKRNRKKVKRGRKRLFNPQIYKLRFVIERTFAWLDKFKRLLIRFERKDAFFLGAHYIAFTLINLRHILVA